MAAKAGKSEQVNSKKKHWTEVDWGSWAGKTKNLSKKETGRHRWCVGSWGCYRSGREVKNKGQQKKGGLCWGRKGTSALLMDGSKDRGNGQFGVLGGAPHKT